ncbi:hypothetical protein RKD49_005414 [Streptomyces glaucescens]|jgi:hypothetical protein
MRHPENVDCVTQVRTVDTGDYVTFEFDYTTASGIKKTLRIPHSEVDKVRVAIAGEYDCMGKDKQRRSFFASLRRKR